ncbi:hypothetical protein SR39_24045 [Methylobacterium radiotolerans]|nr:hypothetical protein SR39_24045 [Methylobacterium radiotolerans]
MSKRMIYVGEDFHILAKALYQSSLRQRGERFRYTSSAKNLAAKIEAFCPSDPDEAAAADIFLEGMWMGLDWPEHRIELSTASAKAWFASASASAAKGADDTFYTN